MEKICKDIVVQFASMERPLAIPIDHIQQYNGQVQYATSIPDNAGLYIEFEFPTIEYIDLLILAFQVALIVFGLFVVNLFYKLYRLPTENEKPIRDDGALLLMKLSEGSIRRHNNGNTNPYEEMKTNVITMPDGYVCKTIINL